MHALLILHARQPRDDMADSQPAACVACPPPPGVAPRTGIRCGVCASQWSTVLSGPLQQLQVSVLLGLLTRLNIPRAVMRPRPLQHIQVPARSGVLARCAPRAPTAAPPGARPPVLAPHGQSCSRAHLNTSMCPRGGAEVGETATGVLARWRRALLKRTHMVVVTQLELELLQLCHGG